MKLYHENSSIFSQSCLFLIKNLKLEVEIEDHEPYDQKFSSEINPIFRVPVFTDKELVLTEPRVIMKYLVETLHPESSLFPKDLRRRAQIDQRLYYDAAVLIPILVDLIRPVLVEKSTEFSQKSKDAFSAVVRVLEGLLANNDYFVGNDISIADFSILPSVSIANKLGLNWSQYPHLDEWFKRMQKEIGYESIEACADFVINAIEKFAGKCTL